MSNNCLHPTCFDSDTCRREPKPIKQKQPIRRRKPLPAYSAKPKVKNVEMEDFFYSCACSIAAHPYCVECGKFISPNLYRFATAHILPKKNFPSVATHPLNWLKLGATCGCHERTHRLDTFSQMISFRFAVEQFRQFEHEIKERHKYLELFRQYVNNFNP